MPILQVDVEFKYGERVYIKADPEQIPYQVIAFNITGPNHTVSYTVESALLQGTFYGDQLSHTKSQEFL